MQRQYIYITRDERSIQQDEILGDCFGDNIGQHRQTQSSGIASFHLNTQMAYYSDLPDIKYSRKINCI